MIVHEVLSNLKFFTKCVYIRANCIFEMTHFTFIVIAHINDHGVRIIGEFVKFLCIKMNARIGDIKSGIIIGLPPPRAVSS